jgi:hypothetical protein
MAKKTVPTGFPKDQSLSGAKLPSWRKGRDSVEKESWLEEGAAESNEQLKRRRMHFK